MTAAAEGSAGGGVGSGRWSGRWRAVAVGLGLAGVVGVFAGAALPAAGRPGPAVRTAALDDDRCPEWGCGANHNQVLV